MSTATLGSWTPTCSPVKTAVSSCRDWILRNDERQAKTDEKVEEWKNRGQVGLNKKLQNPRSYKKGEKMTKQKLSSVLRMS